MFPTGIDLNSVPIGSRMMTRDGEVVILNDVEQLDWVIAW